MIRTATVIAAALGLSACAGVPAQGFGPAPLNPSSRYSLQVEPGIERIALAVRPDGVSPNQARALDDLIGRFWVEGAPALVIEAPAGDDPVAGEMAYRVRGALVQAGVPAERVRLVGYHGPDPRAPVLVGYETLRAVVPQCGTAWGDLSRNEANAGASNFGCAVTANLAAQIANPRDIVQPRAMTPYDTGRRAVVFSNYRAGQPTSAPQEQLIADRRVSSAVE